MRHLIDTHLYAHLESAVLVVIVTCATWLMLANASPRKPYVAILERSSNLRNLLVVKRSHTIGRSSLCKIDTSVNTVLRVNWYERHREIPECRGHYPESAKVLAHHPSQ